MRARDLCKCGNTKITIAKTCKYCRRKEMSSENNPRFKHGDAEKLKIDKNYWVWAAIIQRCCNPNNKGFKNYGGRGIFVCDKWKKYEGFIEDMGKRPSEKHMIDRINNDDGYYKENCRWVERSDQMKNRRELFKNKSSKYKGVWFLTSKKKWSFGFLHNGKKISGGSYESEEIAYQKMILKKSALAEMSG